MDKENAQRLLNGIVDGLRSKRVFTVIDSKSNGSTAYFKIGMVGENGGAYDFQALMNYLGFKPWKSRGYQRGNVDHCAGGFRWFIWYDISLKAKAMGLELPDDFQDLIEHVPDY